MLLPTPLPGLRLPVILTRSTVTPSCSMEESDGTCSLRLREPCEWDGKMYAAVVPVGTLPVLSGAACHCTLLLLSAAAVSCWRS